MRDYGHTCLLIFAQGTWKGLYKERLIGEIKKEFISNMDIDEIDRWNEIFKVPLFNPTRFVNFAKVCDVCYPLIKIFEEKKENNDSLIFFSHNILGWKGMEKFLLFILGEANVKKIYFLELDQDSYTKEAKNRIPEIIENITDQKVNRTEFFKLFENKQLKFSTLYEVSKY